MSTSASRTRIAVGCTELPPGMTRVAFFRVLSLLEMRLPNERAPAERVAERWREEAGAGYLSLVAPRPLSTIQPGRGADLEAEMAAFAVAATHARADAVLFITPPALSPSSAHRDALRRFFDETASAERFGEDTVRVWQPDGLWRPVVAAAFAAELGIVAATDPLAGDPLEEGIPDAGEIAYARITGLGRPSRPLGIDDLERLIDWTAASDRAFIAFATPTRYKDAVSLARALGTSAPEEDAD
jgi:uncharacterized protein YecE (DUF72 family)